jgi:signal peptidase II
MSEAATTTGGWMWSRWAPLALAVAVITAAIDQAHKYWMLYVYDIQTKGVVEITPFLNLRLKLNTGVSFSLFDQNTMAWQYALASFAVIASLAMWVWLNRASTGKLMTWSLALIIGGAIGNAVDRVLLGGVADFFELHAYGYSWPVFNIADVAIVAGVAGLLYDSFSGESGAATGGDAAKLP